MPEAPVLVSLATLAFLIVSAILTAIWRMVGKINHSFMALDTKVESVRGAVQIALDTHERRDQERHEDSIQRLTRVETLIGNGHAKRRRAA